MGGRRKKERGSTALAIKNAFDSIVAAPSTAAAAARNGADASEDAEGNRAKYDAKKARSIFCADVKFFKGMR